MDPNGPSPDQLQVSPVSHIFVSPGAVWHSANVQISLKQSSLIIDINQLNVIHMRLYFKIMYVHVYMSGDTGVSESGHTGVSESEQTGVSESGDTGVSESGQPGVSESLKFLNLSC